MFKEASGSIIINNVNTANWVMVSFDCKLITFTVYNIYCTVIGSKFLLVILFSDGRVFLMDVSFIPMKLNYEAAGYYRVSYTKEMRLNLATAIRAGELPLRERMSVLNDRFALVLLC